MSYIFTAKQFVEELKNIAQYKTLYVNGCFGAPMTQKNKDRYTQNTEYNKLAERQVKIMNATDDTFGFDCVCLIKGLLWGWNGDLNNVYGGATYASNGVADMSEDTMLSICTEVSTNFKDIEVGEFLWMEGHCGIAIGNAQVIECTPLWKDGVQITHLSDREWVKHGKLPWVDYTKEIDISTGEKAIDYLNKMGKLSSPEYWISAIQIVNNLGFVFMKWAEDVKNLE